MELTQDTLNTIDVLFDAPRARELKKRLQLETSDDRIFGAFSTPIARERIWLAIVKMCSRGLGDWDSAFDLAKTDWRDLLMVAGFGLDTRAHLIWKREILRK